MSTLTIRLPDNTAERLKLLARSRGLSVNKLVEEMSAKRWPPGIRKIVFVPWRRGGICNRPYRFWIAWIRRRNSAGD